MNTSIFLCLLKIWMRREGLGATMFQYKPAFFFKDICLEESIRYFRKNIYIIRWVGKNYIVGKRTKLDIFQDI